MTTLWSNPELFADPKFRQRMRDYKRVEENEQFITETRQLVRELIHQVKLATIENEQLKDFLAAETDRELQAEQQEAAQ